MTEETNLTPSLNTNNFEPLNQSESPNFLPVSQADWLKMTEKLSHINKELLTKISQLETALIECRAEFSLQQKKVQSQDTLLLQQTEDLSKAEEQVTVLFHELESSHQVAQKQQVLIQSLSEQLDHSQEKINHLEQQCKEILKKYQEQSKLLQESENNAVILRDRLQMQQRHTSQFKAAIEKYLQLSPDPQNLSSQAQNIVQEWEQEDKENLEITENLINSHKPPKNQIFPEKIAHTTVIKTEPVATPETVTPTETTPHISTQKLVEIAQQSQGVDDMIEQLYTAFGSSKKDLATDEKVEEPLPSVPETPITDEENQEENKNLFYLIQKKQEQKPLPLHIELPKLPRKNHED